jgi:hypothetical protein
VGGGMGWGRGVSDAPLWAATDLALTRHLLGEQEAPRPAAAPRGVGVAGEDLQDIPHSCSY